MSAADEWTHHPTRKHAQPTRGTWTPERIIQAIQEWAAETGSAPRTIDWDPSAGRGGGHTGSAPTKFERERSRWPAAITVYRRFDSWAAACDAAGVEPPYATSHPKGSVTPRVERARALSAAGRSVGQIAVELGVHPATAQRYLQATDCPTCGAPVATPGRVLCQRCATLKSNPRRWTEAELLAAARAWERETGRIPTGPDWLPGGEKWDREAPRWPTSGAVKVVLGGFQELRLALGVDPYQPRWDPELIVDAIQLFVRRHGRPPNALDFAGNDGYPWAHTVAHHFGSFDKGVAASGFTPASAARLWDQDRIVQAMREFEAREARRPRGIDWKQTGSDHPTRNTVVNRFGSFDAALDAAFGPARG